MILNDVDRDIQMTDFAEYTGEAPPPFSALAIGDWYAVARRGAFAIPVILKRSDIDRINDIDALDAYMTMLAASALERLNEAWEAAQQQPSEGRPR